MKFSEHGQRIHLVNFRHATVNKGHHHWKVLQYCLDIVFHSHTLAHHDNQAIDASAKSE